MDRILTTFKIFGLGYFVYLALAIAIGVTLVLILRKFTDKQQFIAKIVLISLIGLFALTEYIGRLVATKTIRLGDQLPFEICDVFVGLSIYLFFSKKLKLCKLAYLIIAPVSLYALIFTPNFYVNYPTLSLTVISFYILQSLLISNSILYMLWEEEDLEKRDIIDATMSFVIIIASIHLFNVFARFTALGVHANYMGTMGETYDTAIGLLYKLIPIPLVCLLPLIAILVGVEFLLILPFDLIKTNKKRKNQIEELIALGNMKAQQEYREKHKSGKSQILVRSEQKAMPIKSKNISNESNKNGFLQTTKEVKVNNDTDKK